MKSILPFTWLILFFALSNVNLYAAAPVVSTVTVPAGNYKIGSVITFTIVTDGTGYTVDAGTTINGIDVTSTFATAGGNNYTLTYTVGSGNTDRASVGAIPINILIRNGAGAGNLNTYTTPAVSGGTVTIDANAPTISNVTIPNVAMKVGNIVTATITVGDDGGQTYTLSSGTIGGFTLGGFTRINNTTYEAQFTVTNLGTDVAAGSNIPVNVIIADPATNPSAAYTTAIAQAGDPIDANLPTISSVTIPNSAMKVGSVVTATITVGNDGGQTYTLSSGTIGGFTVGSLSRTNSTTYSAQFTVSNGGTDVAAGSDIPVSLVIADPATNPSATYNTAISQGGDPIDANIPTITSVAIPDVAMKVGDLVTATISVGDDGGQTYTLSSSTIGGFTLGSFSRTNNTTYTAQFTITNGGTDVAAGSNIPVSIIVADPATNPSVAFTAAIAQAGDPIDANNPAVQIVGPLVTTGGTVVANFWNSTNTGINITVPISNSDASLDNGSIQLQANINGGSFSNVGIASTITNGERVTGQKVFSLTDAEFEAISNTETNTIRFRAIVSDNVGNTSTFTQSALITIDQTAPAAPGTPDLTSGTDSQGVATGRVGTNSDNITNSANPTFTGSAITGNTVIIFSSLSGQLTSAVAAASSYSVAVGAIAEGVHSITARQSDPAGNLSSPSAGLSVTIDRTPPAILGVPSLSADNPEGPNTDREVILISFTENVDLGNNLDAAHNSSSEINRDGFIPSAGDISNSNSYFTSATDILKFASSADGQWGSTTTIKYNNSSLFGTDAADAHPNYIHDIAGNEMASVTKSLGDTQPVKLASGFVLDPNGNGAEKIVVKVNEELNLAEGAAVTGFSASPAGIATAIYTGKGTSNLITLTATGNNTWTNSVTISYSKASGNVLDLTGAGANELADITNDPIRLQNITIASNNANTQLAKAGDVITVNFVTATAPSVTPKVILDNDNVTPAVVTGAHPNYQATYTITGANNNGLLPMLVYMLTATDSTATTATTLPLPVSSSITVDRTVPIAPPNLDFGANNPTAQDTGPSSTDNYTATSTNLFFSGTGAEAISTIKLYRAVSTLIATTTANGAGAWNVTVPSLPAGAYSITATSTDAAGNVSTASSALSLTIDNTTPTVTAITLPSANPNNTSSVNFTVVFDGPVANVDITDFSPYGTASLGTVVSNVIANTSSNYTVTVSGISVLGQLGLNLIDDGTIIDFAGNDLGGSNFASPTQYSIVLPEPPNHVTSFQLVSTNFTSMTLNWVDAIGSPSPAGYLITVARSGATAIVPSDYTIPIAQQTNLVTSTTGYLYVAPGDESASFNNLLSGETYTFKIYPYTNSGADIDFKTDGVVPTVGPASTPVDNFVWINNQSPLEPASFPSTTTSSGVAVVNFRFQVYDNGWGSLDNASTKITEVRIRRNLVTDQIGDWFDALQSVELTDGVTTKTGTIDPSGDFITFSGLYDGVTEFFGEVADNGNKYYMLKVILKTSLGGTLPQNIDNKGFVFEIRNADLTLASNSSTLNAGNDTHPNAPSSGAGNNKVSVTATKFDFTTNLPPTIGVKHPFLVAPVVVARDINNNTDVNHTNYTLTLSDASTDFSTSNAFSLGVLTLNNFVFNTPGIRTITISSPGLTSATSDSDNITGGNQTTEAVISDNTTVVVAGAAPGSISSVTTVAPGVLPLAGQQNAVVNFSFTVQDDNAVPANEDDILPTRIKSITIKQNANNGTGIGGATFDNWQNSIAGASLRVGATTVSSTVTINANSIVFDNLPSTTGGLGFITDGTSRTYTVSVWLQNPVNSSLRDILDGEDFVFEITNATDFGLDSTPSNLSSTLAVVTGFNSGNSNNTVTVTATQLDFITQPAATQSYDAPITPTPTAKARDANQNLDRDFGGVVTVATPAPLTYPLVNSAVGVTAGNISFNSNLQVTSAGNGANNASTNLVISSTGLTNGSSNSFVLGYSAISNIIKDTNFKSTSTYASGDGYPENILYNMYQASTFTANTDGIALERFILQDGGGSNDADGTATKLQTITLNISNYQYLRTVAIYDGSTKIAERAVAGNITNISGITGDLVFPSLLSAFQANDNGINDFTVFATFNQTAILDNEVIQVRVNGATPAAVSSSFVAGGTVTTFAPLNASESENKIEVVATQIDFTVPASASISVPFTVQVKAHDSFANLDLDYNGTITATETNPSSDLLFHTINNPTGAFVNGQLTYPANFQFDIGDGNVQLTINSGAGSGANNVNAAAIAGSSPTINVLSSFESTLSSSAIGQNINYINYQAANITGTADGFTLDNLQLKDGGADLSDLDGATTILDDLTLGISNPQSIQKIAVYTFNPNTLVYTEIQEQANAAITVTSGYGQITFNNLNIAAADNNLMNVVILATFNNTASVITDRDTIQVSVLAATLGTGSKFAPDAVETGTIGGITKSNISFPLSASSIQAGSKGPMNKLDAIATSLDFVTQPSIVSGINEPIDGSAGASPGGSTGIVHARDKFAVIDTDFTGVSSATTISADANPFGYPGSFTNGVLNLFGMQYANSGDGTLIVKAGVLDSSVPGVGDIGNSIACSTVDVIHVTAIRDDTNGVELNESLKGGTTGKRIFGLDFFAEHSSASEPSLTGFAIIFRDDNGDPYPYTSASGTVYKNFKLFMAEGIGSPIALVEGIDYTLDPLETQTAALISSGAPSTSKDKLAFILTNPVTLYQSNYKFYLNVDIDVNVSVGTPPITPYLIDLGYGFNNTNNNIKTTVGSSTALVQGITRKFASVKPPVLVYTSPSNGQLNVDPALNVIKLKFDVPVVTFDGVIKVYNRETGTLRATFTASNGVSDGSDLKSAAVDTLEFVAPVGFDFKKDTVYYVTIEKGVFSNIDVNQRRGISDEGFNLYGGIEYNGTFYFKGSSPNPPELVGTDATKYYFSPTSATFNFQFNQTGKVHYMVVHPTSPGVAPLKVTNAQILGDDPYTNSTIMARGTTVINQQAPNLQYVTINANLTNNIDYYVYAFAENDANPIPIATKHPFGSSTNAFAVDADGPTLKIKKTSTNTNLVNNPRFEVCSNSSVRMEEPIIISEPLSNAGDFATGFGLTDIQSFNILLPTGFQFDVTKTPTIKFNGADFKPLPMDIKLPKDTVSASFINTTILRVSFINNGSTSFDNIIISNLYIIASSTDINGDIIRYSGTGLTTISDGRVLARITSGSSAAITFTNSYNEAFSPWPYAQITKTVTYIPDNFANTVKLIPDPPAGDYGASFFSGSGLTNDVLTLAAVTKDAAFNITLTHTDQNGCNSTTVEQYLVYDHTKTIPELLKTTVTGYNISGTKVGLKPGPVNSDNILGTSDDYVPGLPTATLNQVDSVSYIGLAGYQLIDLYADIPVRTKGSGQVLNYDSTVWKNLVNNIPRLAVVDKNNNGGLHDFSSTLGQIFKTYNWEYSDLINKNLSGSLYPYDSITSRFAERVKSTGTANGKLFFNAGSLGIIEFTGVYQSTADFSVFVPFRQEVELFIPAIPVVEVSGESDRLGRTPIFCENGSPFTITGYPLATSGDVTGFFTLKDSVSGVTITDPGFVDNGNGTATFSPSSLVLKNSYKTIKVEYTYQQNNSPAVGTGVLYIRVTPNPVANFTTSMLCEDIDIAFTDTSTLPAGTGATIERAIWTYADNKALAADNTETIFYPSTKVPTHKYQDALNYPNVSLSVTTNFGCDNVVPATKTLSVGGTPQVAFNFSGVSTADPITFESTSSVANDVIAQLDWTFGDGATGAGSPIIHDYSNAGSYIANLKVTSSIGCNANLSKSVIILPRVISTIANPYLATFETDNGEWQHAPTDTAVSRSDSWAHGAVNKVLTKSTIDGTKAWATSLTGTFNANERSALYSPSFDISGLTRPMVSFDKFVQFNLNEGVIIQYSVDNKNVADETKEWHVLGEDIGEGVEWFNGQGIASKPGDQPTNDFGWYDSNIEEWREAKHSISDVTGKPAIKAATRLVFRFAFAARESAVDNEGFALDNFRLGERTRIILHESFANTGNSSAEEKSENDFIRNFKTVGTDVVRINYHTAFPGADPFNLDNPADNSSRALFYNVSKTPDSYLDGEYGGIPLIKQKFSAWGEKSFDEQTLSLANATIKINQTIDSDGIKINVDVTAIDTTIPKDSVALFIGVLEESIPFSSLSSSQKEKVVSGETVFNYVLKKMLPSASGTVLSAEIPSGTTKNFGLLANSSQDEAFTWKPDPTKFYSLNTSDLAIVAFLQNVFTKKIYQSSIVMDLNDPIINVVTGIESILPEQVNIYPNPASKEFRVELPAFLQSEARMHLIDLTGRKYDAGAIAAGSNAASVNVENLPEGIYILEIGSGNTGIIRKKIMVVMKN